jgi:four helix bundle protein
MGDFQRLKVWQRAKELAVSLYRLTEKDAFVKDHGLRDQMRRAGVSIPSNIAEGDELDTDRQAIKFFYIAKGSSPELLTQAIIAHDIGYLTNKDFDLVQEECRAISRMLARLIQARSKQKKGRLNHFILAPPCAVRLMPYAFYA